MGILYAITILFNALLLFLVQPMIAKMLLPYLGGTPSVWNTCMVFFQAMLLGGYAYSHLTTKALGARRQIMLHLVLLISAAIVFPIGISDEALKSLDGGARPVTWLLWQLFVIVGLPFFMLSTGGPLLQQWFSKTEHPAAKDPYFLYGASNLGSLAALLGYPLLMEPSLRLRQQSWLWAAGYLLLTALIAGCAAIRWKNFKLEIGTVETTPPSNLESLTNGRRARWVMLAFVPSSLMLGVTTFLSTDISPIPLLWVLPLALYLLTFILVFAQKELLSVRRAAKVLPLLGILLTFPIVLEMHRPIWLIIPLHLLFFFLAALVCHGQLAKDRPTPEHLTEFYLWLSVGGVLGGLFNSLLAPNIFSTVVEYPLAIVLALMLRPRSHAKTVRARDRWLDVGGPFALGLLTLAMFYYLPQFGLNRIRVVTLALGLPCLIGYAFAARPFRFALFIGAMMLATGPNITNYGSTLRIERNFFGVLRVSEDKNGRYRQIYHGNTLHGRQSLNPDRNCEPLSYYHRRGPLGQALRSFATNSVSPSVAVIGLGTGAMACYAGAHQEWTFYEIDPAIISIAQNSKYFTYLSKCATKPVKIIVGDARLRLQQAKDKQYELIVLDAFSSDAIPIHLLTKEAFDLYLSKLADSGRLLFHVSNQYLDLQPVIGDLAASANLVALVNATRPTPDEQAEGADRSIWIVMARRQEELGELSKDELWKSLTGKSNKAIWKDDFSNILSVLKWK